MQVEKGLGTKIQEDIEMTKMKDIYLAGGCFWGTEHFFKQIEGVVETEVGFANGHTENPTYKEVYTDETGYAETVHIRYNPDVSSLDFLLRMFFKAIDPTSLNKQGHDEGTRYRTGIFYIEDEDLPTIDKVFAEEQQKYDLPLAVEKQPLVNFYKAEEYHQDYLDKNPDGYCHLSQSLFEFARQTRRIRQMEQRMDHVRKTLDQFPHEPGKMDAVQEDIAELEKYYGSSDWRKDFDDDEQGLFPDGLKRGVLSEDAIWNLLSDYQQLKKD